MVTPQINNHMKKLKKQRGYCKGVITHLSLEFPEEFDVTKLEDISGFLGSARGALKTIQQNHDKFQELQDQIDDLRDARIDSNDVTVEDDAEPEEPPQDQEAIAFLESFLKLQLRLCKFISQAEARQNESQNEAKIQPEIRYVLQETTRIQEVNIPTFDGSDKTWDERWELFRDLFNQHVHQDKRLSDAQKFQRLKGFLDGDALALVQHIPISDENYGIAYKNIFDRFDSKDRRTKRHLSELFDLAPVKKDSAGELNTLLIKFKQHLDALEVLEPEIKNCDFIIKFLLSKKLEPCSLVTWEKKAAEIIKKNGKPALADMFECLQDRVSVLQSVQYSLDSISRPQTQRQAPQSQKLVANGSYSAAAINRDNVKCGICDAYHPLWKCNTLKDLPNDQKISKLSIIGACTNCLKVGHSLSGCKCTYRCRVCKQRHNTALHDAFQSSLTPSNAVTTVSNNVEMAAACMKNGYSSGMLATAIIEMQNETGGWQRVRAFLDSGSQVNYCTSRVQKMLKLRTTRVNFQISGIGGAGTSADQSIRTHIRSRLSDYVTELSFAIKSKIVPPLPTQLIDPKSINWPDYELADPLFHIKDTIDVLLGAEIFFEIIGPNGGRTQLSPTLWLQSSALGPLVVGNAALSDSSAITTATAIILKKDATRRRWYFREPKWRIGSKQKLINVDIIHVRNVF